MDMKNLIFIFSLPRSGSTLLQCLLMRHREIHSVSEPWLLLPPAYMAEDLGAVSAPYNHNQARQAISDMTRQLPRKDEDLCEEIAQFAWRIYDKLCPEDVIYFLDKTPRYYLIIPFIARMFPEAKFVFLFRHPLAVFASIINTFHGGRLGSLYLNEIDLDRGPKLLVDGWERLSRRSIKVNYEDFVSAPEESIKKILEYLELDTGEMDLSRVNENSLSGKMGDHWGVNKYDRIVSGGADKWKRTFNTRFRIWIAKRYLKQIGPETLSEMGYEMDSIVTELDEIKDLAGVGIRDALDFARSGLYRLLTSEATEKILKKILIPGCLTWRWRNKRVETK